MAVQIITTRSGSSYRYDDEARTVTWRSRDGESRVYSSITDAVIVEGYPFVYAGTRDRDGKPTSRRTTPIVSVVMEAPQIDADTLRLARLLALRDQIENGTAKQPTTVVLKRPATESVLVMVEAHLKIPVIYGPTDGLVYSSELNDG